MHYLDAVQEEAGGVVRAVLDVVDALQTEGTNVTLLTGDTTDVPDSWKAGELGRPSTVYIERNMTAAFKLAGNDRKIVAEEISKADVVHLHTPWDRYNVAVAAEARKQSKPYIISIHGMLDDWCMEQRALKKRLYLKVVGRRMLEGAARLHFTAEGERKQAMKWAPHGTASVLPLVMDLSPYQTLPGPKLAEEKFSAFATGEPVLLFLSRVHPKKGIELLLDSAAELCASDNPVQLVVAGPGDADYQQTLVKRAADLGIGDRTHFVGMVRGDEKLSLYQASTMFVLPTQQENFGIVLTEAMACALPTITTKGTDIWKELQDAGAAIVERSTEHLAGAIRTWLTAPDSARQTGIASRNAVMEWLDPQRVVESYVQMYQGVS